MVVELQAKPGRLAELSSLLQRMVADHGPSQRGFLVSTRYEVVDDPDTQFDDEKLPVVVA